MRNSNRYTRRLAGLILALWGLVSLLALHHVSSRPAPNATTPAVVLAEMADLAITSLQAPAQVQANSALVYTIVLTNFGPHTADTVTVSDTLPAGTSFVSCQSTAAGVCGGTGNNRTVSFASLAPSASAIITLTATVNCTVADAIVITNTATVSAATADPNNGNNAATLDTTIANPVWLYPLSQSFAANGGAGSVNVSRPSGCAWTPSSNDPWITITGIVGNTINYSVAAHTSAGARSGTLNIAGRSFAVLQGALFNDVPETHPFYTFIGKLSARGVTQGCGGGNYCPESNVTREQMAAFIIRALHELGYVPPPPAQQRFDDVPSTHPFYAHIEEMAVRQITGGCTTTPPLYCPTPPVARDQMAAFIIRALHEPGYIPPPPAAQRFDDVPPTHPFYAHIEEMAVRQITLGCSTTPPRYCPAQAVTRGQMAAFLMRAFDNPNLPPAVSAGSDQIILLPNNTVALNGAAADDGLPTGGALSVAWSKVSGPGTVSFNNPHAAATQATFSAAGVYVLRLTANDSALTTTDDVTVAVTAPLTVNAGADQVVTLPNTALLMGTVTGGAGTITLAWSQQSGPDTVLFGSASAAATAVIFRVAGVYVLRLTALDAQSAVSDEVQVTVNADPTPPPPDPATVAPPPDPSQTTTIGAATEFLYTGANPIQTGVAPGTIKMERAAVLRGRVLNKDNTPLSNVKITVLDHPEFGQTMSRADGRFDLAVNGGGTLNVKYEKTGFVPVQRTENVPWQDYCGVPDVVLIGYDPNVTFIDLNASTPVQVAQGGAMNDASGTRRARLFFMQGTTALMKLPGGAMQGLDKLHVRTTEFTVGTNGAAAMPGDLPPNSAYTYALEYSLDEAVAAGATDVIFSQPVISYEENFLGFPTGLSVPTGYYDRASGRWVPSASGRVVKILSITGGQANLDLDGSNTPASDAAYAALGVTVAERQQLAALYAAGQSLWRTPLTHFSPWDKNWSFGPPAGAAPPPGGRPGNPGNGPNGPGGQCGSVIRCEPQTLGESVDVTGTPFSLNYESGRTPGRKAAYSLIIPLSGASVPAPLKRIDLEVSVAGRMFTQSFSNAANQTTTFTWDGQDAYGRTLQGSQRAGVRVGYVYDGVYQRTDSFGYNGNGLEITGNFTRQEVTLWQASVATIGAWDARGSGLGAWTLSVHHAYDPNAQILYLGTGDQRSIQGVPPVITTVAGGVATDCVVNPQLCQDGAPATQVELRGPTQIAVDAQGTVYVVEGGIPKVHKVTTAGLIYTVAGTGVHGYNGDNIQATNAQLNIPYGVAVDAQGNLYISDTGNYRIRKVNTAGIITTIAGTGVQADECADPQNPCPPAPAVNAKLCGTGALALDQSGNLYFRDCNRIKKIDQAGNLSTVVYTAVVFATTNAPALDAQGNLYYADQGGTRVVKLSPDAKTTVIAGGNGTGTTGDGGQATQALVECAGSVALDREGNVYISQGCNNGFDRVRRVTPDGIINTFAGAGQQGYGGDGGPARAAGFRALLNVVEDGLGNLYIGDNGAGNPGSIRKVAPPLPRFSATELLIAAEDGREVYVFNLYGRHLRTVHPLTGAILYQFTYDSAGRLTQVTDGDNNVTTVQRNGAGNPTAIVGPFGQSTALTLDANGFLTNITDPANQTYQFTYTADGLMTGETDPRGSAYSFIYNSLGQLTKDTDPATGFKNLARTDQSITSYSVAVTTALNRTDTYQTQTLANEDLKRIYTDPAGLQTQLVEGLDAKNTTTYPDGMVTTVQLGGDPRWKLLAPLDKSTTITTPGALAFNSTFARAVTLSDSNNLFSLTTQNDTLMVNGRTYTNNYAASTKTFTLTTPVGRQATATIDTLGRTTLSQFANLNASSFIYDAQGRLASATGGTGAEARTTTFAYNAAGFLASVTDPLTRVTSLTYDLAGRVTQRTLPGGRVIGYGYDANGNLTSITPPGRPAHVFAFTPINLTSSYTPPAVPSTGQTTYAYNLDRQLTSITRPDSQTLTFTYDAGGRPSVLAIPGGQYGYTYHATTGNLTGITAPGGINLSFTYDGSLLNQATWAGAVAGSVGYTYDNDFRLISQSVNGANPINFSYDNDSLLTSAGALTLTRNAQTGLVSGTTLSSVTDSFTYNGFAELTARSAAFNATNLYSVQYTYDKLGRITQKIETVQGAANTFDYAYDTAGRLAGVTLNGAPTPTNTYAYDQNGNRTSASIGGVVTNGTYDNQDRLTQYGAATYAYTANGELQSKTVGGQTTQYSYDVLGNLKAVTLPNNTQIDYLVDGRDRRVGKKVGGALVQGFLYEGQLSPVAELDGANNVVSRFVYASRANVPDYLIKGGVTYRLITDHLGSVRLVVDVATGSVAQRIDYDEFGVVLADTNPGFQPFGFAGGLYDKDTGLVRFGARDYAQVGRWTAKDPILFAGGDTNLYGYVLGDPVNLRDSDGLEPLGGPTLPFFAHLLEGGNFNDPPGTDLTDENYDWARFLIDYRNDQNREPDNGGKGNGGSQGDGGKGGGGKGKGGGGSCSAGGGGKGKGGKKK